MFVFISAKCRNPLYVLQISDSVRIIKESPRQVFNDTDTCCSSGFLITRTNTTTCLENGEWELDTSQINCKGSVIVKVYCGDACMSVIDALMIKQP